MMATPLQPTNLPAILHIGLSESKPVKRKAWEKSLTWRDYGRGKKKGRNTSKEKANQGPAHHCNLLNCFSTAVQLSLVFQF